MILKIDITDWKQEADSAAVELVSEEDVLAAMQETDLKPVAAARQLIVNRELGKAQAEVLPPNKILLQLGGGRVISQRAASQRADVSINGSRCSVRRYVGTVTVAEGEQAGDYAFKTPNALSDESPTLVEYTDPAAQDRAIQYLMTNVVGRIDERIRLIAAGKGDVGRVAQALKAEIDRIAERYG